MRNYRPLSAAVFVVAVCALIGGFYGRSPLSAQNEVPDQYRVFTAALNAIESDYVGDVESDTRQDRQRAGPARRGPTGRRQGVGQDLSFTAELHSAVLLPTR